MCLKKASLGSALGEVPVVRVTSARTVAE